MAAGILSPSEARAVARRGGAEGGAAAARLEALCSGSDCKAQLD